MSAPLTPVKQIVGGSSPKTLPSRCSVSEGIVVGDGNLQPIALDAGAEMIFGSLVERSSGNGDGVPPQLLELMRCSSAHESDTSAVYIDPRGHQYSCRVFDLKPRNGGERMIVLYLRREVSLVDAIHQLAADHHLTEREQEALIGLSMGLTSKQISAKMNISPNTVKAFVRLAMIKMGTSSRAGLFAKLLDRQSG